LFGLSLAPEAFDFTGLRLMAHVAGIGDVFVNLNEWIAGPSAPSRIEGIAVEWPNKPPQFDIRYSVKLGQPQASPSRMMDIGSFAGTRGRAMPLTGVVFELSGAASSDYQVRVEATFLGSPTMRVIGKRVVLSGPTGREPLVGLRMNLELANVEFARDMTPATRPLNLRHRKFAHLTSRRLPRSLPAACGSFAAAPRKTSQPDRICASPLVRSLSIR
jgi:hypothetical protein